MATNSKVTVSTTLPMVGDNLESIHSARLILRPLHLSDLEAYRTIRSQAAAMTYSGSGLPDSTMEETEAKLKRLQPPYRNSHVYFGIFLKKPHGVEGDLIGDGGVHKFANTETGWPEFGYKFKEEYWGKGYATEFAKAFMIFWWKNLLREDKQILVAASSVNSTKPVEQVCAWTKPENRRSERVLEKVGFERFQGLDNGMTNWRLTRELFEAGMRS